MRKRILAVASEGGHWIQLMRLKPAFENAEVIYISTNPHLKNPDGFRYYSVEDANRNSKFKLIRMFFQIATIVFKERPHFVISTGAAPGLIAIMIAKFMGSKTIWIDSIANSEELSMSGKFAIRFSNIHLTQWENLAKGKTLYKGNIIE